MEQSPWRKRSVSDPRAGVFTSVLGSECNREKWKVSPYTWLEPSLGPGPGQLQCMCGELAGLTLAPGPLLLR